MSYKVLACFEDLRRAVHSGPCCAQNFWFPLTPGEVTNSLPETLRGSDWRQGDRKEDGRIGLRTGDGA